MKERLDGISLKEVIRNVKDYNMPIAIIEDTGMSFEDLSLAQLVKDNSLDKYKPVMINTNDMLCRVEIRVVKK